MYMATAVGQQSLPAPDRFNVALALFLAWLVTAATHDAA
jgi:hypothetical protein